MGVRTTASEQKVALYDSVMDQAFGPVFDDEVQADLFLYWYQHKYGDPRLEWWADTEQRVNFLNRYGEWRRAVTDPTTNEFRIDIAENIVENME